MKTHKLLKILFPKKKVKVTVDNTCRDLKLMTVVAYCATKVRGGPPLGREIR